MKTVDKYQFNEELARVDHGLQSFLAFHVVLKKYFTLRRIGFNGEAEQNTYNSLIKQVSTLKKFNHDNIYRCHKMLKTKNNLYLIYDNIEGQTLQKSLKNNLSFDNKLSLVRQISSVLYEMGKANVVHLGLSPQNVIIMEGFKIKVVNFGRSQELAPNQHSLLLNEAINGTITNYTPPEVFQNKIHKNSDIYSFGMIINTLFDRQFQSKSFGKNILASSSREIQANQKWVQKLSQLVKKMVIKLPQIRLSIGEIDQILNQKQIDDFDKISVTNKSSKSERVMKVNTDSQKPALTKNVSDNSDKGSNKSNSPLSKIQSSCQIRREYSFKDDNQNVEPNKNKRIQQLVRKILKKRNFTIALLFMASSCCSNKEVGSSICIILSYLLTKKATLVITQLAKLLKVGRSVDMAIEQRIKDYFYKSNLFLKINPVINKQMQSTQQKFQAMVDVIKKLPEYLTDPLLKDQIRQQKINNDYLRKCVSDFLSYLSLYPSQEYCNEYSMNQLAGVYLISLVSSYDTYEQAYDQLFSENATKLQKQPFFVELLSFNKQTIINFIELGTNIKQKKEELNSSMRCKSAKTVN